MHHTFTLSSDYIELNKVLKFYGIGDSGGQSKQLITQGMIKVNGKTEGRIRNKLVSGDIVRYNQEDITITIKK